MRKNEIIKFLLIIIFLAMMPRLVSPARHCQAQALAGGAAVEISEIMYNLPGGDEKREWIEIFNNSQNTLDLASFRFAKGSSSCPIHFSSGSSLIVPGGFAIIADTASNLFLTDWPAFSGSLYYCSCLELKNTTDVIAIKDGDSVYDTSYSSDLGANGDGNSLQKVNGQWKVGIPTPGVANVVNSSPNNNPPASGQSASSSSQSNSQTTSTEKPPEMLVNAGANRTVVVGADALFSGKASGTDGKPLENVRFIWNFGDGETKEGQNVLHRFRFPSEYIVTLDIAYGKWSAMTRLTTTAIKSPLIISRVEEGTGGFVEIANEGSAELDLFGWYLKSGNVIFLIPKNTTIIGHKKIVFPNEVTKLTNGDTLLLYPNGVIAASYEKPTPTPTPTTTPAPASSVIVEKPVEKKPADLPNSELGKTKMPLPVEEAVAAVYEAEPAKNSLLIWLLALGGLIVISLGALIFTKRQPASVPQSGTSAGEYEIIE